MTFIINSRDLNQVYSVTSYTNMGDLESKLQQEIHFVSSSSYRLLVKTNIDIMYNKIARHASFHICLLPDLHL